MKKNSFLVLTLIFALLNNLSALAQENEPDFIGEAYILKSDNSYEQLDKEIGDFTSGMSFSSNSWNALSLEIQRGKSQTRFPTGEPLNLIVRALNNNSDPLSIIRIYKFKAKKNKRTIVLSEDNKGTVMKSRTHSKDMVRFNGKRYGSSSYLITLKNLKPGEYGIIVSNPNSKDEKRAIVSCFAIDK